MNDNDSHIGRNFSAELYGVSQDNPILINTSKRIYMPVWAEDNASTFLFDGWYVPQSVTVVEGTAVVTPGPDVTNTVDGVDYTTPGHFEVFFNTAGRVVIEAAIANIGAGSTTLRATRDYFVLDPNAGGN